MLREPITAARDFRGSAIDDAETYGEIYGVLTLEDVLDIIPPTEREIIRGFKNAVSDVKLHVDTGHDVAITADIHGEATNQLEDLAKTLGGALSLLRLKARAEGDEKLSELLDHARIVSRNEGFRLELALPLELIQEHLGECAKR